MKLRTAFNNARRQGMNSRQAQSKVCQDVLMEKITNSKLKQKITLKGGTVMYQLTKGLRPPTMDFDIDVIETSLKMENLTSIISIINKSSEHQNIKLDIKGDISESTDVDYYGYEFYISFNDTENEYRLKINICVHTYLDIEQGAVSFDLVTSSTGITMKSNNPEQMIVEKTTPIIKWNIGNRRIKDIFDIYWLQANLDINTLKIKTCLDNLIVDRHEKTIEEYFGLILNYYRNPEVYRKLKAAKNWTGETEKNIILESISFFKKLKDELVN